jgi:hypothetical protein
LPGLGEEAQMQRRLLEKRRERQSLLLDLGAIVYELHRQGRRAPDLLQRKAAQLTVVDDEVRALEAKLGRTLVGGEPEPEPPPHHDPPDEYLHEEEEHDDTEEVDAVEPEPEPALANHEEPRG